MNFYEYLTAKNDSIDRKTEERQSSASVSWESLSELQKNTQIILGNFGFSNTNIHIWNNDFFKPMQSDNESSKNVLLIGVGYPNEIKKQWISPTNEKIFTYKCEKKPIVLTVPDIERFETMSSVNGNLVHINDSHIKDFLRASILEDIFNPCCVYTVTTCGDELRHNDTLSKNESNVDVCTKEFIPQIIEKGWKIDEICLDHYRMMDSYSSTKLGRLFFENLKTLAKMKLLNVPAKTISGLPEIYLPFQPHFFFHVHGLNLEEYYTVEYVTNMELNESNRNTLYAATNSHTFNELCKIYGIDIRNQDRLITHRRNTFFQYTHPIITPGTIREKLKHINDVNSVRFILLILRRDKFYQS